MPATTRVFLGEYSGRLEIPWRVYEDVEGSNTSAKELVKWLVLVPLGNEYWPRVRNHAEIRLVRPTFLWLDLYDIVIPDYGSTDLGNFQLRKVLSRTGIITTAKLWFKKARDSGSAFLPQRNLKFLRAFTHRYKILFFTVNVCSGPSVRVELMRIRSP